MSYFNLNRDGRWPQWTWSGLDRGSDGALRLSALPRPVVPPPPTLAGLPSPDGPAGVAVAAGGAVFYSDPAGNRLWRIDPCDGTAAAIPSFGGSGSEPGQLRQPRGILYHARRGLLFVADSGNHRIQLIDPESFAMAGIWGQADPTAPPSPGSGPGQLDTPWDLAADPQGDIYVVDYGNRRVQKRDERGGVIASFWQHAAAGMTLPVAVAVRATADGWEVLVLDGGAAAQICVFTPAGQLLARYPLAAAIGGPASFLALALDGDRIYVGDNAARTVQVLAGDGTMVGEASAYAGPVAALTLARAAAGSDCAGSGGSCGGGGLWLHPGSGAVPLRLDPRAGRLRGGVLWGGPFDGAATPVLWHRLVALAAPLDADAHLQLYFATGNTATAPLAPVAAAADPFAAPAGGLPAGTPAWTPLPLDATQGLVRVTAQHLWLGAHLGGEGVQTPVLAQVRVEFDPVTWSQHLPAIYREQTPDPELLERFLALFASAFEDVETEIRGLGRYLDIQSAPPAWLPWLAGWVGITLEESWTPERQRAAIASALAAGTHRGTAAGLMQAVRFWAGVDIRIAEPILAARWWSLPAAAGCTCGGCGGACDGSDAGTATPGEGGGLGFDSVLAPAGIAGAVVGTTAVLDRSYLTSNDDAPGAHLYAQVAHQFAVQVYERQVADPETRAQLIATLEREKPAHTAYHLCVIAPRMRVGFQAQVGIDTVVGGQAPARALSAGGGGLVLGGAPPGRIGEDDRIGIGTRLGTAGRSGHGRHDARGAAGGPWTDSGSPAR